MAKIEPKKVSEENKKRCQGAEGIGGRPGRGRSLEDYDEATGKAAKAAIR